MLAAVGGGAVSRPNDYVIDLGSECQVLCRSIVNNGPIREKSRS